MTCKWGNGWGRKGASASLLAVVLAAGAAFAGKGKVITWHDRAVDFSQLRTFDFPAEPGFARWARERSGEGVESDILETLEEVLAAMGLAREQEELVDFWVVYQFLPPEGAENRLGPMGNLRYVMSLGVGRGKGNLLYLELQNPGSRQPIWRGRTHPVISKRGEPREEIRAAVRRILAEFPPEAAGR